MVIIWIFKKKSVNLVSTIANHVIITLLVINVIVDIMKNKIIVNNVPKIANSVLIIVFVSNVNMDIIMIIKIYHVSNAADSVITNQI